MITEALVAIDMLGKDLLWNPKKTDKEFIQRITSRTRMSPKEFYVTLQKGIHKFEKNFPKTGVVCLNFLLSEFVAIVDMDRHMLVTIRDARWDKPSNKCNTKIIVSEKEVIKDIVENIFEGLTEFDGYHINVLTESEYRTEDSGWLLEVVYHCDSCIDIDL